MNSIIITGRLGRDPEAKTSSEGNLWAQVSVAEDGGDEPNWFDVRAFGTPAPHLRCAAGAGETAEVLHEYGAKGRKVAIQGRMVVESYEANGQPRKAWKLIASRVEFLDTRGDGEAAAQDEADPPV